ncbi:unnamed protein product [Prorocentrum cordatum]|uniref:Uncharacterized protein n=1 Tax=Prorocentrum cordatum TaxID=2364126 RepID=A0ABN9PN73_9DINO|nr:unnamed protein product [Polarella glacialis]
MREEVGQGFGGDQFSQMMVVCPRVSSVDIGVQASSSTDVADFHCEVGCQTESVVGMEGGASGVLLGKVTLAAEEELEAPSSEESSPNVQSDSDSRALSGASQGCLNRPVTLNEVSNPVRGHRKGRGKGQRYHRSAKPAKSSKGANIRGQEYAAFGFATEEEWDEAIRGHWYATFGVEQRRQDDMKCLLLQTMHKMDDNTERIQDAIVVQGSKIDNVQTQVQKQGVAISSLDTRYRSLEARQNQLEAFVQRLQGLSRAGSVASAASTRPVFTRPANAIHYT